LIAKERCKQRNSRGNMYSTLDKIVVEISHLIGISTTGAFLLIGAVLLFLVFIIVELS